MSRPEACIWRGRKRNPPVTLNPFVAASACLVTKVLGIRVAMFLQCQRVTRQNCYSIGSTTKSKWGWGGEREQLGTTQSTNQAKTAPALGSIPPPSRNMHCLRLLSFRLMFFPFVFRFSCSCLFCSFFSFSVIFFRFLAVFSCFLFLS